MLSRQFEAHWLYWKDFVLRSDFSDWENQRYCWQHGVTTAIKY